MADHDLLAEHLRVLELRVGAGTSDVKRAYRQLVKVWHPDRFQVDEPLRERAEAKLRELNGAYTWLLAHEALLQDPPRPRAQPRPMRPPVGEATPPWPSPPPSVNATSRTGLPRWVSLGADALPFVPLLIFLFTFNGGWHPAREYEEDHLLFANQGAVDQASLDDRPHDVAAGTSPSPRRLAEAARLVRSLNMVATPVPSPSAWSAPLGRRPLRSTFEQLAGSQGATHAQAIRALAASLGEPHTQLIGEGAVGRAFVARSIAGLDPTYSCYRTVYGDAPHATSASLRMMTLVRDYFADLTVDVACGKGVDPGPGASEFDWFVVLERNSDVVYSFIFYLQRDEPIDARRNLPSELTNVPG